MKRRVLIFLLGGVLLGIGISSVYHTYKAWKGITPLSDSAIVAKQQELNLSKVPEYALEVLTYVETFHQPKPGYEGGKVFHNFEKHLPELEPDGKIILYKEWDVHPKEPHKNRGPERLVTGSNKSAWYTRDHYNSFIKIH